MKLELHEKRSELDQGLKSRSKPIYRYTDPIVLDIPTLNDTGIRCTDIICTGTSTISDQYVPPNMDQAVQIGFLNP